MDLPTQSDLFTPALEALGDLDGRAKATEVYEAVASRIKLSQEAREARKQCRGHVGKGFNLFERQVRWVVQRAKAKGLLRSPRLGEWELTGKGRAALTAARPGKVLAVIVCRDGFALFGHAEDAFRLVDPGSVQLLLTSPPYPLLRQKQYGNRAARDYNDWLCAIIERALPTLADDGSLVLNIGEAWEPGEPVQSTFSERLLIQLEDQLGLKLAQRFIWENPSKLPAPAQWVTIEKQRVKPSLEAVWWLSPSTRPKARQSAVLTGYSDSMKKRLAQGGEVRAAERPSGYQMRAGAFGQDRGGAIPPNLIRAANTESNSSYVRGCRAAGLPVHPARFPRALPDFFVRLCTDPGDTVMDCFGGSGTLAESARLHGRFWILVERIFEYLQSTALRLGEPIPQMR